MPVQTTVHDYVHESLVKINISQTPKNEKTEKNDLFEGRDPGLFSIIDGYFEQELTPITIKVKRMQKLCATILNGRFHQKRLKKHSLRV